MMFCWLLLMMNRRQGGVADMSKVGLTEYLLSVFDSQLTEASVCLILYGATGEDLRIVIKATSIL